MTKGVAGNAASLRAARIAAAISRTRLRPSSTEGILCFRLLFVYAKIPWTEARNQRLSEFPSQSSGEDRIRGVTESPLLCNPPSPSRIGGKMKSSTSSIGRASIALAGALFIAAGAIAFVAVKTSTSTSHATSTSQAKQSMSHFRALQEALETSLGATRSGEPQGSKKIHNGRAQQLYDDQAYPRKWVEAAQQITAANAAKQIASLAAPLLAGPWTALGPNGVAADAL